MASIKCIESKSNQQAKKKEHHHLAFGGSNESPVPEKFIWSDELKASESVPELHVPRIDMKKFTSGNEREVEEIKREVDKGCRKHGVFMLVNHGVDMKLVKDVEDCMDEFFTLPLDVKQRAKRKHGGAYGYGNGFIGRFSSNLPWKETFSVPCLAQDFSATYRYVSQTLGQEFSHHGKAYEKCGKALNELSLKILEILALSLELPRDVFKKFYEDNDSSVRLNYYPRCEKPELTLGTGPHCDPTSITILHQDHVPGLQVYVDHRWYLIPPTQGAFVINIGDTFMSLTNGVYKSCVHRAVVNCKEARKSMAFFLSPGGDKVVRAPDELVDKNPPRNFPDFKWPMFLQMTQTTYRPDSNTFKAFTAWLQQKNLQNSMSI